MLRIKGTLTFFAITVFAANLVACHCPKPLAADLTPRAWPAPISADEQLRRLLANDGAIPYLRATRVAVKVRHPDNNGQLHEDDVDGTLLIRQRDAAESPGKSRDVGDILLVARAFGKELFQAGHNAQEWWFILTDEKNAWVGNAAAPASFDPTGRIGSTGIAILRADFVVDLLGIAPRTITPTPGVTALAMKVDDVTGTNDLLLIAEDSAAPVKPLLREVLVNRVTGNIDEVRLYTPAGVLIARSLLSDYRTVATPAARLPYHVQVDYPSQQTRITLQFNNITIPPSIPDAAFQTPDFNDQGLNINRVN